MIYHNVLLRVIAVVVLANGARAQKLPDYPRVNAATWYAVDPLWPRRPKHVTIGTVCGVAVDKSDRVWMASRCKHPVQIYDREGRFLRAWEQGRIRAPHQLRIDAEGNIWIADVDAHVVMKFTPQGELLLELGTRDVPGNDALHFNMPTDMAITPSGDVFVSDGYGNGRVVHFDSAGRFLKNWGKLGTRPGELSLPHAIVVDSQGKLYVADRNNVRVQVFDQEGNFLDHWSNLVQPWGLWMTPDNEIWVCGAAPTAWENTPRGNPIGCPPKDQLFMKLNQAGRTLQLWTVPKGEDGREKPGELNWVHCIAVDSAGNIFAGDVNGRRLQKFVCHAAPGNRLPKGGKSTQQASP